MRLIDADKLITEIKSQNTGKDPKFDFVVETFINHINHQPEVFLPAARVADPKDTPSGYFFDKGWNAFREELLNNA